VKEAVVLLLALLVIALMLVALTNTLTIQLSFAGAALALIYPLMKRVTHWPQIVLGVAFAWSIPMAFAASTSALPSALWWLFAANVLWTVVYDTQYAMVDREDDLAVGINRPPFCSETSMSELLAYCSASACSPFGAAASPLISASFMTPPLSRLVRFLAATCGSSGHAILASVLSPLTRANGLDC